MHGGTPSSFSLPRPPRRTGIFPSTMVSLKLLLLFVTYTSRCCNAVLELQLFQNHPCGDSTPSGIYSSPERSFAGLDHVIVFQGGGACSSDEDCLKGFASTPNKFSSADYPLTIEGETIISEDASRNINGLENSAKWFVPYCSQDAYLGMGVESGGLQKSGSLQFAQALQHWADTVNLPRRLIVVGISIGAMGVLNHLPEINNASNAADVEELIIVLDSGILSAHELQIDVQVPAYIRNLTSEGEQYCVFFIP